MNPLKPFQTDRTGEGFTEGLRRGADERKDHRTTGLLKAALQPFDHSHKTCMDGLEKGCTDGLEEKTVQRVEIQFNPAETTIPTKSRKTAPSMSRETRQLGERGKQ